MVVQLGETEAAPLLAVVRLAIVAAVETAATLETLPYAAGISRCPCIV